MVIRWLAKVWKYAKYVFEFAHSPYRVIAREVDEEAQSSTDNSDGDK